MLFGGSVNDVADMADNEEVSKEQRITKNDKGQVGERDGHGSSMAKEYLIFWITAVFTTSLRLV